MLAAGVTIFFECVTVVFTWVKTIPAIRQLRRRDTNAAMPVLYVIFHDGEVLPLILTTSFC